MPIRRSCWPVWADSVPRCCRNCGDRAEPAQALVGTASCRHSLLSAWPLAEPNICKCAASPTGRYLMWIGRLMVAIAGIQCRSLCCHTRVLRCQHVHNFEAAVHLVEARQGDPDRRRAAKGRVRADANGITVPLPVAVCPGDGQSPASSPPLSLKGPCNHGAGE